LLFCSTGAGTTESEDLEEADDELLELLFLDPDLEREDSELLELDELLRRCLSGLPLGGEDEILLPVGFLCGDRDHTLDRLCLSIGLLGLLLERGDGERVRLRL
jgi:hypothetical protein